MGWLDFDRTRVKLAGGYTCDITCQEENAWHEYVSATPEWREFVEVTDHLSITNAQACGGIPPDAVKMKAVLDREVMAKAVLYELGKSWFETILEQRARTPRTAERTRAASDDSPAPVPSTPAP